MTRTMFSVKRRLNCLQNKGLWQEKTTETRILSVEEIILYGFFLGGASMFLKEVDLRSRLLAFRGAGGEPHSYVSRISVSLASLSRRSLAPCAPINNREVIKNKKQILVLNDFECGN
jgi:hypothetical protein